MPARRALNVTAALVAAVFLFWLAILPPAPAVSTGALDSSLRQRTIAGAVHVHSTRSDGTADRDAIAAAAARAGLRFVVITDHGDATRAPDVPAYLHGVLMVDAVEISTNQGHYVALDVGRAPYPLGGEAATVVEDVRRLGGVGFAAHPYSGKPELQWTDWDSPIDGLEWLNFDSEWRDEPIRRLLLAALAYPLRKGPALATLLDRPSATLARWDGLASRRRLIGIAGHDAHGGWGRRTEEGGGYGVPGIPSYEASFRTFAVRAVLNSPPSGDAQRDWRLLSEAIRAGRTFTAIDAVAGPAWIDYRATVNGVDVRMGESHLFAVPAELVCRATIPEGARMRLLKDGVEVASASSNELRFAPTEAGSYRVEVSAPRAPGSPPAPWIVTNPIYLTLPARAAEPTPRQPEFSPLLALDLPGHIEKHPSSSGRASLTAGHHQVDYELSSGARVSQFVALSIDLPPSLPEFDAVSFEARSVAPMRVSVQLRFNSAQGARWGRSVYVSNVASRFVLGVDSLRPLDGNPSRPPARSASSLLFVVDLTNAAPGAKGQFEITNLALGR
jgi:hypothetical protein